MRYLVRTKQMKALGYKGSGMFENAATHSYYYKKLPERCRVICVSNTCPQRISVFDLSKKDWLKFSRGKLSLVPPGCCCASGGESVPHTRIVFESDFKSIRQVRQVLDWIENEYV